MFKLIPDSRRFKSLLVASPRLYKSQLTHHIFLNTSWFVRKHQPELRLSCHCSVCVCVFVCVRACVRACVRVCVFVCFRLFVFANYIIVGRLFRNIHPSLEYSSCSCIHTSLYDFFFFLSLSLSLSLSHVHPALCLFHL